MNTSHDIIAKIKKLLDLSTSSNINEATAAAKKANELIDKYRISQAELELSGEATEEPIEIFDEPLYTSGRMMYWKKRLASILCDEYGCTHYYATVALDSFNVKNRTNTKVIKVVGRKSNFDIIKYMFAWLTTEIERLTKIEAYGKGHTFSQSFSLGAVIGIEDQFRAQKKDARVCTSAAMVLVDNQKNLAKQFLNKKVALRSGVRSKQNIKEDAFSSGREKGNNIHLGKAMSGSNIKKLN